MIPFNLPFLTGKETEYIVDAVKSKKLSGNGKYTKLCQEVFENDYGLNKTLLTTSGTDALEMTALLTRIGPGDEVIIPSYTFVSTANAFILRGADIVFADSMDRHPNLDVSRLENFITPRTKAIVPVHYAGVSCDMDELMKLAKKHDIKIIEDAAQGIESTYKGKPLGGIGDLGIFSFHETKNIIAGEGGLLSINNDEYKKRAEIIWEKGTNRAAFFRGEIDKYGWVDLGSSFLPSEVVAAFLYAQLQKKQEIQQKRKLCWDLYHEKLKILEERGDLALPIIPEYASNNAHMYYVVCNSAEDRNALIKHLRSKEIHAVFHYLSLHKSEYFTSKYKGPDLPNSEKYSERLLRLPLFFDLTEKQVEYICDEIANFYWV